MFSSFQVKEAKFDDWMRLHSLEYFRLFERIRRFVAREKEAIASKFNLMPNTDGVQSNRIVNGLLLD